MALDDQCQADFPRHVDDGPIRRNNEEGLDGLLKDLMNTDGFTGWGHEALAQKRI